VYKNYTADYKFFQEHQQKSRRFPVFPEGISNSRRFPVFPGVVDTLYSHTFPVQIIHCGIRPNVKQL